MTHLYYGDCLLEMRKIKPGSIDMVMADLPYGTTKNKWDSVIPIMELWDEYRRVCKPSAAIVLMAQAPFDKVLGASNLKMLRYEWIWEKPHGSGHLNARRAPMKAHENILVFYGRKPTYNPQMTHGHQRKVSTADRESKQSANYGKQTGWTHYDSTIRFPRSVLKISSDKQRMSLHPTQKPLALMEYLVLTYTDKGQCVLDNVMGSGTTGVACVLHDRDFIGVESDLGYFKIAENRIENSLIDKALNLR